MKNVYSRSFESAPPPQNIDYSKGFTLAEVLITLGIIGIVAAMTMPTLITNYQKKETATRLKYAYSVIAEAVKMSEIDNGPMEDWLDESTETEGTTEVTKKFVDTYLTPYVKTVKTIKMPTSGMPYEYYYKENGQLVSAGGHTHYSIALANGIYLHFNANYSQKDTMSLRIDTNGQKGPNIVGRDTFFANFNSKGFYMKGRGYNRDTLLRYCKGDKSGAQLCGALIEFDGWEIKKDYPW